MPVPRSLPRWVVLLASAAAGVLAVIGCLAVRGPGLVAVAVGGMFAACVAAGIARESAGSARTAVDAAVSAAGWTVGSLLVLAGVAAVAGGAVTVLLAATVGGAVLVRRLRRAHRIGPGLAAVPPAGAAPRAVPTPTLLRPPVRSLGTADLGQEWVRTTALLAGRLEPAWRRAVVGRRGEVLDELERRDPTGFARWLADGPVPGSDPAAYVRDLPAAGTGAA
ncbi:hypothetical protein [Blastococcus sp. TF02A-30]|uniref:hypothetical protein n=1 Tax=Blastococcus sp. TF02A-30 TaxID=2250580 RepID=UPI0011BFC8B9|nr:hypothetical protein [Blastococcus sp. TF02A-30]